MKDRSNVIHELRRAELDKAGPATGPPGTPLQQDLELEDIRRVKGLKSDDKGVVEGLEGESLIHWIHRK